MKIVGHLLMICLIGLSMPVTADDAANEFEQSGNKLVTYCNDQAIANEDMNSQMCVALVKGMIEGFEAGSRLVIAHQQHKYLIATTGQHPTDGLKYCMPKDATWAQDVRVVSKYLHDNPDKLNKPDWLLVLWAFQEAWPCKAATP